MAQPLSYSAKTGQIHKRVATTYSDWVPMR